MLQANSKNTILLPFHVTTPYPKTPNNTTIIFYKEKCLVKLFVKLNKFFSLLTGIPRSPSLPGGPGSPCLPCEKERNASCYFLLLLYKSSGLFRCW